MAKLLFHVPHATTYVMPADGTITGAYGASRNGSAVQVSTDAAGTMPLLNGCVDPGTQTGVVTGWLPVTIPLKKGALLNCLGDWTFELS